jgi:ribonuclease Z
MKFTFLGTSAGVPTKQRNVTGLALGLEHSKDWCLVDCGEGTQQQLLHTTYSLSTLAAIFITHVHGDHCYGLPGVLASAGMSGRTAPLKVIAPKPLQEFIEVMLRTTDCYIPYELVFIATEDINEPIEVAGFAVEPFALSHRVPCHAWRFTELNMERKLDTHKLQRDGIPRGPLWGELKSGQSITLENGQQIEIEDYYLPQRKPRQCIVAGDNDQPELLVTATKGIDLLIHEATYTQAVSDKVGPAPMHSSAKQLAIFAEQGHVPNLIMTHFSARYGGNGKNSVEQLRIEAEAHYSGEVYLAEDFASYQLKVGGELKVL